MKKIEIIKRPFANTSTTINTLCIYKDKSFTEEENNYLKALDYLFSEFGNMTKDNSFCMHLSKNTFLIGSHRIKKVPDPLVFVNEKGEILFNVNIEVFNSAIKEFNNYINYYKKQNIEISEEEIIQKAIIDYKNDILDYYANSAIPLDKIIEDAKTIIEQ